MGSVRAARRFLRDQHVSLVVGLGGFASIPAARAAVRRRVPLILLEQNAFPGRATRLLSRSAQLICLAMAKARPHLPTSAHVVVTGNPLRAEFVCLAAATGGAAGAVDRQNAPPRLLVLGGSGGSSELNAAVPKALYKVRSLLSGWQIVHQCGQQQRAETDLLYRKLQVPASVVPFVLNMPQVLRWTDLAVCRAGGTTLSELAVAGVPAVLIPWRNAAGDHQRRNAEVFSRMGAAVTLDADVSSGRLDDCLAELLVLPLQHAQVRQSMSAAMQKLARPDATWQVTTRLQEVLSAACQAAAA